MLDWHGSGMSVMEMSHRGKEFISIYEQAEADFRELLAIPANFKILFMQGGGLAENAIVPLNLSRGGAVDFVLTGSWSEKSFKEAGKYCQARVVASDAEHHFTHVPAPASWQLGVDSRYLHLCTNETIHGVEIVSYEHQEIGPWNSRRWNCGNRVRCRIHHQRYPCRSC
jgi:phosphoserine aminotransferase